MMVFIKKINILFRERQQNNLTVSKGHPQGLDGEEK